MTEAVAWYLLLCQVLSGCCLVVGRACCCSAAFYQQSTGNLESLHHYAEDREGPAMHSSCEHIGRKTQSKAEGTVVTGCLRKCT